MTGRPRLDELYSLACWEPAEEAEAAAILDTLTEDGESADAAGVWLRSAIHFQRRASTLEAENRELRRILYAAIDPESGAQTAQAVRDLIQGELNAIATTREVIAPGSLPPRRGPRPQSTEKQGPGALTSFGPGDFDPAADVRHQQEREAAWQAGVTPTPHDPADDGLPSPLRTPEQMTWIRDRFKVDGLERLARADRDYADSHGYYLPDVAALAHAALAALARLRARDQARTDALTEDLLWEQAGDD